ncbi:uncharacterized protein LOC112905862 [Agrilus planipennis]|uniref:Uncharacterized protein LOC112905861 n=1 Tax=Agrilus planipennis TaxID=224129 RepID=A0A7F5RG04_AGRPL|nr:uncharacterized protein LOC112905861 [Agrilus planipennis]XP_025834898.1 uncharacterized protein LOC112905862 [Agrilus planipennis]
MNKLTATINEVAIDAFIVNFGLRFTEISVDNTTISWRFSYNNSTKQLTSLNVLPQFGTITGRVAVDLGGRVFERAFSDKNAIDAVNNMMAKNSAKVSADLMKIINFALQFYANTVPMPSY